MAIITPTGGTFQVSGPPSTVDRPAVAQPVPAALKVDPSIASRLQNSLPLAGQAVVVIFNPAARDGSIAHEMPQVEAHLRDQGADVKMVKTVPDPVARLALIKKAVAEKLDSRSVVTVVPYGGDGTIGETVRAVTELDGWKGKVRFSLVDKGTAADVAKQVGAPKSPARLAAFIAGAVPLDMEIPLLTSEVGKGNVASHSNSSGAGGILFERRARNREKNPKAFYNRGVWSFLRLLPYAMRSPVSILGLDFHIQIKGDGRNITRTVRASEVMVTPNRIVAAVSGTPGPWGRSQLQFIPHGGNGPLVLGELIFRGLVTKVLGENLVGPSSQLYTLGKKYEFKLRPGDEVKVKASLPNTWGWRVLKWLETRGVMSPLGYDEGFKRVLLPPTGDPIQLPSICNGDLLAKPVKSYSMRMPEVDARIPILAHPQSLAVEISTEPVVLRHQGSEGTQIVRTPLFKTDGLAAVARRLGVSPERIPELLALHGEAVTRNNSLIPLAKPNFNLESLGRFPSGEKPYQVKWLHSQSYGKAFLERA